MRTSYIVVPILALLAACGSAGLFGNSGPDDTGVENNIPAWDGVHIICNETISFDSGSTQTLPEFPVSERLGFCDRSMKYLALNREFGDKTTYFGISAALTGSLAATYAPLVRRAYSGQTWDFMQKLNLVLDANVNAAMAELLAGNNGGQAFTDRFIEQEQNIVQEVLDNLQATDPQVFDDIMQDISGTLNPTNPMLLSAINRNPFFAAYEASLAALRVQVGGNVDYDLLDHRLEISAALDRLIKNITPYSETDG